MVKTFLREKVCWPSHLYYYQRLLPATCPLAPINFSMYLFHTMSLLLPVNLYTHDHSVFVTLKRMRWTLWSTLSCIFLCRKYRNNLMHVWNKTWEKYPKSWHLYWKYTFLYQNFSVSGKIFKISLYKNVKIPNDQDGSYLFF